MSVGTRVSPFEHPLALGSFRTWLRLLRDGGGIDPEFWARVAFVTATTLLTSPLRLYERLRFDAALRRVEVHRSPIFIVGHWRTGTTFMQHLLCKDASLGYLTLFQALAPGFCLGSERLVKPLVVRILGSSHPTRIIDNVPLVLDSPQEDEYAISNASPYSFLHAFSFPCRAGYLFDRYVLFNDLPDEIRMEWVEIFMTSLRKASLRSGGKRLVLKNPAAAGRIPQLLELFPDAKFIYMTRDPYRVFPSLMFVYQSIVPRSQVQRISADEIETHVLESSAKLMRRFAADRRLIPAGNLVEVRFEDLERAPLKQMRGIYESLSLPGFSAAEPAFRAYLGSIEAYQKNEYDLDDRVIDKVNRHWGFVFAEWGYPRLEVSPAFRPAEPGTGSQPPSVGRT